MDVFIHGWLGYLKSVSTLETHEITNQITKNKIVSSMLHEIA